MNKIIQNIVGFFSWLSNIIKKISQVFDKKEKIVIISAVIVLIGSGSLLIYDYWIKNTHEVANYGGVLNYGIIAETEDELTDTINRLTKVGLTTFNENGEIVPALAESWEVSDDIRQFRFKILPQFSRDEVIKELEKQKDIWPEDIKISAKDNNEVVFDLSEPFSPFLATTTKPVLSYGPYVLDKEEKSELILKANEDYYLSRPYIDKIVLKIYPDRENLNLAYQTKDIDAIFDVEDDNQYDLFNHYNFVLPRYNMIFFNTQKDILNDKEVRKKIANNEKLDGQIELAVVVLDNEQNHKIVDEIISKWSELNIKTQIFYKNPSQIIDQIIPARDYDVLVYGLNYGFDPDPYAFWHSTQSGEAGLNLSNFSNIDADVALEDARKTIDFSKRQEEYNKFWDIFNDEMPAIIVSQDQWSFAVNKKVKGVFTDYAIGPEDQFENIYNWYIKTKRVKK